MNYKIIVFALALFFQNVSAQQNAMQTKKEKLYAANWESLRTHEVPKWAKDAKFGIYAHWGVYSVTGNWDYKIPNWGNYYITGYKGFYGTNEKQEQHQLFEKNVGKIEDGVGYKDLAKTFTAPNFDAKAWVSLIKKSGAQYAGMCAVHHDGYCMWDSEHVDYCAGKLGAKRDFVGELFAELKKNDIKTIASFHHGRTFKHFEKIIKKLKKDPKYANVDLMQEKYRNYYWFAGDKEYFVKKRKQLTMEFIDKYSPDVLWFDGGGGKYDTEQILAHFFNNGIKNDKEVCVHNKGNFGKNFGVYSYENGHKRPSYVDWPWEDDTPSAKGWCDWQWDKKIEYKTPKQIVRRLCDLVSRNGGLLLSMNPRPDGTFDKGQIDLLEGIGKWMKVNSEAIYGARPWITYGEGNIDDLFYTQKNVTNGKLSRPIQPDTNKFDETDIRFTVSKNNIYAMVLNTDNKSSVLIKSLANGQKVSTKDRIKNITLLGHGSVDFKRSKSGVLVQLPKSLPNDYVLVLRVQCEGKVSYRKSQGLNDVIPDQT